jgi:uncharacterized protein YecE (DUF72 family)
LTPQYQHGIRVGISGWRYAGWRGSFYPKGWAQRRELEFASRHFDTIEINGSFYSLQRAALYRQWREETPENFTFAVKGGRFITHMKRLVGIETPLANFFASGLLALGPKLGPILWQLPPGFAFDAERLDAFFALLPRTVAAASRLAAQHDRRVKDPCLSAEFDMPIRHALEIRHDSFKTPGFIALLRRHQIALVAADTVEWPYLEDVSADFVYVRLHGSQELYASGYDDGALALWARRIGIWASGGAGAKKYRVAEAESDPPKTRDVYVYFDNDAKARAPYDAMALARRLGVGPQDAAQFASPRVDFPRAHSSMPR